MNTTTFNGAFNSSILNHHNLEYFYKDSTNLLPNFYVINNIPLQQVSLKFKSRFQNEIQDYTILDFQKNENGMLGYKICYVLKNNIFVILDETTSSIKILYNSLKNNVIQSLVQFFYRNKML